MCVCVCGGYQKTKKWQILQKNKAIRTWVKVKRLFAPALRGSRAKVTSACLHFDVSINLSGRPLECCRLFVLIVLGSMRAGHFFVLYFTHTSSPLATLPPFQHFLKCIHLAAHCLFLLSVDRPEIRFFFFFSIFIFCFRLTADDFTSSLKSISWLLMSFLHSLCC